MFLTGQMNPFDFTGPQFLAFYWTISLAVLAAILVLRFLLKRSNQTIEKAPQLDVYETAYLAGGPRRVALVAATALANRGQVKLLGSGAICREVHAAISPQQHAIEQSMLDSTKAATNLPPIVRGMRPTLEAMQHTLEAQGLTVQTSARSFTRFVCVIAVLGLVAMGVWKAHIGIARRKPIGLLVGSMVITGIGGLLLGFNQPFRTARGDEYLSNFRTRRREHEPTALEAQMESRSSAMTDFALSYVALDGLDALASTTNYEAYKRMTKTTGGDGGSWSSCGSSSSCGGSSCGGGGCGGGGCGGCGGS